MSSYPLQASEILAQLLNRNQLAEIDLFDRAQLAHVIQICQESRTLSDAGRRLFGASRAKKTSTNDADRLRKPSTHLYRGIGELSYPFHDRTALVTYCGRICIFKKKINLSTSLAGQAVGIKEVDDGIWLVTFMDYDLGYIDLEEKTVQPLYNPFGPKV